MLKRLKKDQKGFTLTELIIVLLIIAILAAIAIPVYMNVTDSAKETSDKANISIVESAVELYAADQGAYPTVSGETKQDKFNSLITKLYSSGYIKQSEIKAAQTNKAFGYDPSTHTVELIGN